MTAASYPAEGTTMRRCGYPLCLGAFDIAAHMAGERNAGPWMGNRVVSYLCPDHRGDEHVPDLRIVYPDSEDGRSTGFAVCSCGWEGLPAATIAEAGRQWKVHVLLAGADVRILSVQQPWAYAILHFGKDVENRTWEPPGGWTGWMLLHASKKLDPAGVADAAEADFHFAREELSLGCVVGAVRVTGCTTSSPSRWAARGQYHWALRNPWSLERPVPWKGGLGLRKLPLELAYQLPYRLVVQMSIQREEES